MEEEASLKQTVTHLFDAVRHGRRARELEETARKTESGLQEDLDKLDRLSDRLSDVLSTMKHDPQDSMKDLSRQLEEFLEVAKSQAKSKLERRAKEEREKVLSTARSERDKAIQSLEAYLATNPLPSIDSSVRVEMVDGVYEAEANYESEGELKYRFGLGTQNSKLFHQEFSLSQLGHELRIPVRFSRTLLKGRVPGFERLDQYVLQDAEFSNGKVRANFKRPGDEASIKAIASGFEKKDFIGLEYTDQSGTVNVMNDLSLVAHADLDSIKAVLGELSKEMNDVASNKVTLLKLSLEGEDLLQSLDCYKLLETVMAARGPAYRSIVEHMPENVPSEGSGDQLSLSFVKERLRSLGDLSKPISQILGVKDRTPV